MKIKKETTFFLVAVVILLVVIFLTNNSFRANIKQSGISPDECVKKATTNIQQVDEKDKREWTATAIDEKSEDIGLQILPDVV
jgi:hypothetical protein